MPTWRPAASGRSWNGGWSHEAFVAVLEVGDVEGDELAAAQGPGEPDEEQGGVPGAGGAGREGGDHAAQQGDGDGGGLVLGGAVDPSDAGPDRFDGRVVGGGGTPR